MKHVICQKFCFKCQQRSVIIRVSTSRTYKVPTGWILKLFSKDRQRIAQGFLASSQQTEVVTIKYTETYTVMNLV